MHDRSRAVLALTLLGPPVASWAGTVLPIARRQTRALLYRLAAELVPIPRSKLGFLFWPDIPEHAARRNLTHLLTLLRQVLPQPTVLITDATTVALNPERVWSDTATFMHLTRTSAAPDRLAALAAALDLSRGPLLDGFALAGCPEFAAWLDAERHVWERRIDDALATVIETHTVARNYGAAIAVARQALARDPLAEELHRRLIALYAATGDRTAALRQFEQCVVVLEQELGVAPLPETRAVYAAVRAGGSPLPPAQSAHAGDEARTIIPTPTSGYAPSVERERLLAAAHGLPTPPTPLIGRTVVLTEVLTLLRTREVRLLNLAGPGGAGKTRLALEVAQMVQEHYADGVIFVPLAPLRDAALVPQAIVETLGLGERDDRPPLLRLKDLLRQRELLLVLDNCEHVLDAAPALAEVLAAAPGVTILSTSRALLRIAGEQTYVVPALDLPDAAHLPAVPELAQIGAVALFLARVRERTPGFVLTDANATDVAAICTRLDGLPLAIELAAARAALLSPRMLLVRLDHRLALLTTGPRDLPERQRTLRATIDWSYALLDVGEQLLLGRLAVFAGGWTLAAAEQVVGAVGPLTTSVLDGLHALLDKHLVQRSVGSNGEPRFSMLETIREYALERLTERGEAAAAQQAHALYFLGLAEQAAPLLHGPEQIAWFDRLDQEHANLRVALAWMLETGDPIPALRLTTAQGWFWHARGHFSEGRMALDHTLAAASRATSPPALFARAYYAVAELAIDQGDFVASTRYCELSIARWRDLEHDPAHAYEASGALYRALGRLLQARAVAGDKTGVQALLPEVYRRSAALNDPWYIAYSTLHNAHGVLRNRGDVALAQALLLKAQPIFRELGDSWHLAQALVDLALIATMTGDTATSQTRFLETLAEARRLRDRALEAMALNGLGDVARLMGDDSTATPHYRASLRLFRELNSQLDVLQVIHNLGYLALHAGDTALARNRFNESLHGFRAVGQPRGQADALAGLAAVVVVSERTLDTARWWRVADMIHVAEGAPVWPADQAEIARYQAIARDTFGASAFDAAYDAGALLTLDEAVSEALRL